MKAGIPSLLILNPRPMADIAMDAHPLCTPLLVIWRDCPPHLKGIKGPQLLESTCCIYHRRPCWDVHPPLKDMKYACENDPGYSAVEISLFSLLNSFFLSLSLSVFPFIVLFIFLLHWSSQAPLRCKWRRVFTGSDKPNSSAVWCQFTSIYSKGIFES